MGEAAKVIRISGSGSKLLQEAIESGMLAADAERACRQVLAENERLRKENRELKRWLAIDRAIRKDDRRCKIEAYRIELARQSDHQQWRDWRWTICIGLMAIGGYAVAIATVIVLL